jgi:ABC-type bacteriocin/lantibiotic exporter with double-glycine peptidase domain
MKNNENTPLSFLWSVIKPYKCYYLIMMIAPLGSAASSILYSDSIKLLTDLFTQNHHISFEKSLEPIGLFILSQFVLDFGWRVHNIAQLKSMPYIFQNMTNKICQHCFNLVYSYFQNNMSGSIISKIKGIGDKFFKIHQSIEHNLTIPLLSSI